jgi:hypothetical protein
VAKAPPVQRAKTRSIMDSSRIDFLPPTPRLRQAEAMISNCQQRRDLDLACSRMVGRLRAHSNLMDRVRKSTILPVAASRIPTTATDAIQRTIAPGLV